jgi:hypothetical protein
MRGLDLFLKYFLVSISKEIEANKSADPSTFTLSSSMEKLEKLFCEQKFWKFSKDNSLKVKMINRTKRKL